VARFSWVRFSWSAVPGLDAPALRSPDSVGFAVLDRDAFVWVRFRACPELGTSLFDFNKSVKVF